MIPNHKWVKPENYKGDNLCWVSILGLVKKAYRANCGNVFYFYMVTGGFPFLKEIDSSKVDGVCERKEGEAKPELK